MAELGRFRTSSKAPVAPPTSPVADPNPAGPLMIGNGYLLPRTSKLYATDVADLNTFFTATYSAPL